MTFVTEQMTTAYPGKQQEERENRQSNAVIRISLFIYIAFRDSVSNLNISLNYNLLFSFLAFFFLKKRMIRQNSNLLNIKDGMLHTDKTQIIEIF